MISNRDRSIDSQMHPALTYTHHRPWPLPNGSWLLRQQWLNLAFIHWEIDYQDLRQRIPESLEIDLFDGKAWIAIVPFDMKGVSLRYFPTISAISNFPEINVRTYVIRDGKPGVWFFSLDVPSRFAVWAARTFFNLPYRHGDVKIEAKEGVFHYTSQIGEDRFDARYRPEPSDTAFGKNSFEEWCTERYCLYCQSNKGHLYRTEVQHRKWPLQNAAIDIRKNSLLDRFQVGERHPSVLYSESIDVVAYPPERIA